jgi:serine/threonine protein kinase
MLLYFGVGFGLLLICIRMIHFIQFIINKFKYNYKLSLNTDYKTFEETIKKNKNNKDIEFIIKKYDKNNKFISEKKYNNHEYIGSGTYAKVFRTSYNDNTDFIIKLGITYPETTYDEAVILDEIYNNYDIDNKYKYKIESYGINKIIIDDKNICKNDSDNYKEISFIIMPYLGDLDLFDYMDKIHTNNYNTHKLPLVLKNVINNLDALNKYYSHNDVKTDNVIVNIADGSIKIIDFGLCCKKNVVNTILGYRQISPEIIINSFDKDYEITYQMIKQIDNFGLFWLILDCFTNEKLFKKYIKLAVNDHSVNSYKSTLNFYLNLNNICKKNSLPLKVRKEMIDYTYKNIKDNFIEDAYNLTSPYIKNKLFSNKNEFVKFIEKMLLLVNYDYNNRLLLKEFVKEPFFYKY